MSTKTNTQTQETNTQTTYQRRQSRIGKVWNGTFDIIDTVAGTTKDVAVEGGQAVSSTVKLINTGISGVAEIGIISMNSMRNEIVTDAVIGAIHSNAEVNQTLVANGLTQEDFNAIKAQLLQGTSRA